MSFWETRPLDMMWSSVVRCVHFNAQDELAQQIIKAMCRKFATSAKVWLRAYGYFAERHDSEGARKTLDKSMTSLPKRKHIKVSPTLAYCPGLHLSRF